MANQQHAAISPQHIHAPHSWVVADSAARVALAPVSTDVGKYCLQQNDYSQWMLTSHSPVTWLKFSSGAVAWADITGKPTFGTAAALDVAASGDAGAGELVKGNDSRLTDSRAPTAHTHALSSIAASGATTGQVVTYNGSAWEPATPSGGGMTNPMTTAGDIIIGGTSGAASRLAGGTNGYVLTMVSGAPAWAATSGGGGLTGFTSALNTTGPNHTTFAASIAAASSSATNIDAVIRPKGSGALLAATPDSSAGGGNKRGTYSVDLQLDRADADHVAAGNHSAILGGKWITISATSNSSGAVAGNSNSITAAYSFAGAGLTNQLTGAYSAALGGTQNVISGKLSAMLGGSQGTTRGTTGAITQASGGFSAGSGSAQSRQMVLGATTSDATPKDLRILDDNTVMVFDANGAYVFEVLVSAKQTTLTDVAGFRVSGVIRRLVGGGIMELVGTPSVTLLGAGSGAATWSVSAAIDTANYTLGIRVVGESGKTIRWVARVVTVESC